MRGNQIRDLHSTLSVGYAITPMRQASSFSAFVFAQQVCTYLESRETLLCDFCVAKVAHLSGARVVRARLQPAVTIKDAKYSAENLGAKFRYFTCTSKQSKHQPCSGALLVPLLSLALPECAAILVHPHTHQRVCERCANARI